MASLGSECQGLEEPTHNNAMFTSLNDQDASSCDETGEDNSTIFEIIIIVVHYSRSGSDRSPSEGESDVDSPSTASHYWND
jgi:hypothetical protein